MPRSTTLPSLPPSHESCAERTCRERLLLAAISHAHSRFLVDGDVRGTFEDLLECLLTVTGSEYGYIGEVHWTDAGEPFLKTHAVTNIAWNQDTRDFYERNAPDGLEFYNLDTLFGRTMTTAEPVIANDPYNDPRRGGLPEGHPRLDAFLGVPFTVAGELVGTFGLANRPGGYDETLLAELQPLTATCANIIGALRIRRKQLEFELRLTETNAELRNQIDNRRRAESALSRFFDLSLDLLCVSGTDGFFKHINPAFHELLGYTPQELETQPYIEFVHPDDRAETRREAERLLTTGLPTSCFENRFITKDGATRWLRWTAAASLEDRQIYSVGRDITIEKHNRVQEEKRLREYEVRASQMGQLSEIGELLQSCASPSDIGKVLRVYLARMFEGDSVNVYELSSDRTIGEVIASLDANAPSIVRSDSCWALRRGRPHQVGIHGDGVSCDHESAADSGRSMCVPLMAQGEARGVLHICFSADQPQEIIYAKEPLAITLADQIALAMANIELRHSLREQSIRDPLTGLFNRRYMSETLARELLRAKRQEGAISVVLIDLDHFKRYNDTHGHVSADDLLRDFGAHLQRCYRNEDVVCRYGGEEFLVVMPATPIETAVSRTEEMRHQLDSLRSVDRTRIGFTCSAGVSTFPAHGTSWEQLIRAADAAMYIAKREGRDRVVAAPLHDTARSNSSDQANSRSDSGSAWQV